MSGQLCMVSAHTAAGLTVGTFDVTPISSRAAVCSFVTIIAVK